MSICWYCSWGWPQQVVAIYDKYLKLLDDDMSVLEFGPGHIVWSDENFETEQIQWCIDNAFNQDFKEKSIYDDISAKSFILAIQSLKELLLVPEDIRCCEPDDYDGINPKNFPPKDGIVMIKKY